LSKVYLVTHSYCYYSDPKTSEEFFDTKEIAFFYSKEDALVLITKYKTLPGFREAPNGFSIREYIVDSLPTDNKTDENGEDEAQTLYSIGKKEHEDDEVQTLAYFSTKAKAKEALRRLRATPTFTAMKELLEIYEENIKWQSWSEGFIKWKDALSQ